MNIIRRTTIYSIFLIASSCGVPDDQAHNDHQRASEVLFADIWGLSNKHLYGDVKNNPEYLHKLLRTGTGAANRQWCREIDSAIFHDVTPILDDRDYRHRTCNGSIYEFIYYSDRPISDKMKGIFDIDLGKRISKVASNVGSDNTIAYASAKDKKSRGFVAYFIR